MSRPSPCSRTRIPLLALLAASGLGAQELRTVTLGPTTRNLSAGMASSFFAEVLPGNDPRFFKVPVDLGRPAGSTGMVANLEAELVGTATMRQLGLLSPGTEAVHIAGRDGTFLMAERFDRPGFLGPRRLVSQLREPAVARIDWDEVRRMQVADLVLGNWDRASRNYRFVEDPTRPEARSIRPVAFDHNVALLTESVTTNRMLQLPRDGTLAGPRSMVERYRAWDYWKILQANSYYVHALGMPDAPGAYTALADELARSLDDPALERIVREVPDKAITGIDPGARKAELVSLMKARRDRAIELLRSLAKAGPDVLGRYARQVPSEVRSALDLARHEVPAFMDRALPDGKLDPYEAYRQLRVQGVSAFRAARLVEGWAASAGVAIDPAVLHAEERGIAGRGASDRLAREPIRERVGRLAARMVDLSNGFVREFSVSMGRAGLAHVTAQAPLLGAVYLFHLVERTARGEDLETALAGAAEAAFSPEMLAGMGGWVLGATPIEAGAVALQRAAIEAGRAVLRTGALGSGALVAGLATSTVTVVGEDSRDQAALAAELSGLGLSDAEKARLVEVSRTLLGPELSDVLAEALHPARLSAGRLLTETAAVTGVGLLLMAATGPGFVPLAGAVLAGLALHVALDVATGYWQDLRFTPERQQAADQQVVDSLRATLASLDTGSPDGLRQAHLAVRADTRVLRDRVLKDQLAVHAAWRTFLELAQSAGVHALGADGLTGVRESMEAEARRQRRRGPGSRARLGDPSHPSWSVFAHLDHFHRLRRLGRAEARPVLRETAYPCGYTHRSWLADLARELSEATATLTRAGRAFEAFPPDHFASAPVVKRRLEEIWIPLQRAEIGLEALFELGELASTVDAAHAEALAGEAAADGVRVLELHAGIRERELAELFALRQQQHAMLAAGLAGTDLDANARVLWVGALSGLDPTGVAPDLSALLDRHAPSPQGSGRIAKDCASTTGPVVPLAAEGSTATGTAPRATGTSAPLPAPGGPTADEGGFLGQ